MNPNRLLPSVLLLCAGLSAQVTSTGITKSIIGDTARTGKNTSYRFVPANSFIGPFFALRAATPGTQISTGITHMTQKGQVRIRIFENAKVNSLSKTSSAEARTSKGAAFPTQPHIFAFQLKAPTAVKGTLTLSLGGTGTKNATAFASLKFGSTLLSWTLGKPNIQKSFPVTISSTGLTITSTAFARALAQGQSSASFNFHTSISFDPGPVPKCRIVPYGRSCSGLTGQAKTNKGGTLLTLSSVRNPLKALGFTIAGFKQISIPLTGGPCLLLSDIQILGSPFFTDKAGAATHQLQVPLGLKISFNLQDLVLRPVSKLSLSSTNGLTVICR